MTTETANIHFEVHGQQHMLPVEFELGEQPLRAILPVARQLAERLTTLAIEQVEAEGKSISCRAGCGACCRQLVVITLTEAEVLADVVAALPAEQQAAMRAKFAAGIKQLESAGMLDPAEEPGTRSFLSDVADQFALAVADVGRRYFSQQIACPFLVNESCGVYAERPLVCREYHVTSPAADCSNLYQIGVDRVTSDVNMGGYVTRTLHQLADQPMQMIPLILALEWAASRSARQARTIDGLTLVQALVTEIGKGPQLPGN
ncbi:Flagellin N-methylase [Anatilimnocola aggregata]|uniref:Flagellin N-methylase n=1 Tax=Anatilimnocola aggregata TaxID=2528021 RepID=A0A517YBJ6_9BACT|nr:YkgJ family cysteine cluster protein [Anatilimnocola aggregata]QDU27591.1 Flagellin N-methylase [Anatilimnocola aggregata]